MITIREFNDIGYDDRGETKSFAVKDYGQFIYHMRKKAHYAETAIIEVLMRVLD